MSSTGGIPSSHGPLVLGGDSSIDVDAVLRRPELSTHHVAPQSFLNNVMDHHGGTDVTYLASDGAGDVSTCITGSDTQRASVSALYQPSTSLETQSRSQTEHIGISPDVIQSSESLRFEYSLDEAATPTKTKSKKTPPTVYREQDRFVPINNTGRVMRNAVPKNAKISKDAKQCMQECISEFISFLTSEASDRCIDEKRKTITGDDILYALSTLGFDSYVDPLHVYLKKYREFIHYDKPGKESDVDGCHDEEDDQSSLPVQHAVSTPQLQGTSMEPMAMDRQHEAALHMLTGQLPSNSILPNP